MNKDINLLANKRKNAKSTNRKLITTFNIVAYASLGIVAICSIVLFVVRLQSPIANIKKEQETILFNLTNLADKSAKYKFINDRLVNISQIVSKRIDFEERIKSFLSEIPSEISVNSLSVDKNNITLDLSTNSLYSLGILMDRFIFMVENKKLISKAVFGSLSVDVERGMYSFSIKAELL